MRPLFLLCLMFLALASAAVAKTVPITGEGAWIDLPDDWKIDSRPDFALFTTSPDQKSVITLRVVPNRTEVGFDESFYLEAMKQARQQKANADHGSLIIIEAGTASINGVPVSYIHTEEPMANGLTTYGRGFLITGNGKLFSISTDTSDPFLDQKVNEIVGTFRFAVPPLQPDVERPFYRRLTQIISVVACLVFFGAFAAWLVRRRRRLEMEEPR